MTLTSRYFGDLDPRDVERGTVSTEFEAGALHGIPVELAIADPTRFGQRDVERTDMALDFLDRLDERVRETMVPMLLDESTVPGRAYGVHKDFAAGRELPPAQYTRALRIADVIVSPDGGDQQPDRVCITYVSPAKFLEQRFRGVAREGIGFVFLDGDGQQRSSVPTFNSYR